MLAVSARCLRNKERKEDVAVESTKRYPEISKDAKTVEIPGGNILDGKTQSASFDLPAKVFSPPFFASQSRKRFRVTPGISRDSFG